LKSSDGIVRTDILDFFVNKVGGLVGRLLPDLPGDLDHDGIPDAIELYEELGEQFLRRAAELREKHGMARLKVEIGYYVAGDDEDAARVRAEYERTPPPSARAEYERTGSLEQFRVGTPVSDDQVSAPKGNTSDVGSDPEGQGVKPPADGATP